MKISIDEKKFLPTYSGIYFLFSNEKLIYIGKSRNIKNRIYHHKGLLQYAKITHVHYFYHDEDCQLRQLEHDLIRMFLPPENKVYKKSTIIMYPTCKLLHEIDKLENQPFYI